MRILLIEDDISISQLLRRTLKKLGHDVVAVETGSEGKQHFYNHPFDLILTDLNLPDSDGLSLVEEIVKLCPHTAVMLMTGFGTTDTAIKAMQMGAYDYFTKPFQIDTVIDLVNRIEETLSEENYLLPNSVKNQISESGLIGNSAGMQKLYKFIGRVAETDADILITGETGTGKEMVAKALRHYSLRKDKPFVTVNCSALPESIIESELFGHEKGAFTGASNKRIGRFEQANHGTLFLDEIGELSQLVQVKLLRFLQDKVIQPLGGTQSKSLDIRIITATNRNLEDEVKQGNFREDLYYRLKVAHIQLPALREHHDDIPLLLDFFNKKYAKEFNCKEIIFTEEALHALLTAPWPGNIRQLENTIKQLLVISNGRHRGIKDIREIVPSSQVGSTNQLARTSQSTSELAENFAQNAYKTCSDNLARFATEEIESAIYRHTITQTLGHQTEASKKLGVSMKTLRDKLKKYGINPKDSAK